MIKINPIRIYPFTTTTGVCLLFQVNDDNPIYASTDLNELRRTIIQGESELTINQEITINDINYRITSIRTHTNIDKKSKYSDLLAGEPYPYSFVIVYNVEPTN